MLSTHIRPAAVQLVNRYVAPSRVNPSVLAYSQGKSVVLLKWMRHVNVDVQILRVHLQIHQIGSKVYSNPKTQARTLSTPFLL